MKVLFMGTPEFAVPSFNALMESSHELVGVVTQPDRAVKHGKTESGAVKKAAATAGVKIIQPEKIRDSIDELKAFGADIAVTAAYGQLLTQAVIDAFPRGVINVHASLLPKYRGASPIASAIRNGEKTTGVTIMQTSLGLDTGDILSVAETDIGENETAGELTARLSVIGAKLLIETLDGFEGIVPKKQDDSKATHCRTIKKSEQIIDFSYSARSVVDMIRALSPLPCAKTLIDGELYKLYSAAVSNDCASGAVGEIVRCDNKLIIACASGCVEILKIQAPSKRALDIADFLRGKKFAVGTVCGK